MQIQEQEGHLGLMGIQCHCKPQGFKQGCVEGFMIRIKIMVSCLETQGTKEGSHLTRMFKNSDSYDSKHMIGPGFLNSDILMGSMIYTHTAHYYPNSFEKRDKHSHAKRSEVQAYAAALNIKCCDSVLFLSM